MTPVFKRIRKLKEKKKITWDQLAAEAGIPVASWMTGLPTMEPTDEELHKIAPVLDTTYEYLKYGKK